MMSHELFSNNTNLTFLYKINIEGFSKVSAIKRIPSRDIEFTTDHHWYLTYVAVLYKMRKTFMKSVSKKLSSEIK